MTFLKKFTLLLIVFMGTSTILADNQINDNHQNMEVVSPAVFQQKLHVDDNAYLLDVRKPEEYAQGHLDGAHLINWLDRENFQQAAKLLDKSKTIYLYCRSGRRSNEAASYLAAQGYKVVDMQGGILAWEKDGLPINTAENSKQGQLKSCQSQQKSH